MALIGRVAACVLAFGVFGLVARAETAKRYTAAVVPLLQKPFEGEYGFSSVFDHHPEKEPKRALDFWGTTTWGEAGHVGWDFPMQVGTPILAAADGVVLKAEDTGPINCTGAERAPHNTLVKLLHEGPDGLQYTTLYLHLSRFDVQAGAVVKAGQQVGLSGDTGCSTGPHLHFQAGRVFTRFGHPESVPVDPFGWDASFPDPRLAVRGLASVYLWKPGQAPLVYRRTKHGPENRNGPFLFADVRTVAWHDDQRPNQEYVGLDSAEDLSLAGYRIRNNAGDVYTFPAGSRIERGKELRLYTGTGRTDARTHFWNRAAGTWDDAGDCVRLLDPEGEQVHAVPAGRGEDHPCDPANAR